MGHPWDGIVPAETVEHYRRAGFGRKTAPGRRAALLVIDVQYHALGDAPAPLPQALDEHPMSCGEAGWRAVPKIAELAGEFRAAGWPVIYPYVAWTPDLDRVKFGRMPRFGNGGARAYEIVKEVGPEEGDVLLPKYYPSAFFGTALISRLNRLEVDTLFITGCTTSGCIRATAVDAYSLNYKVVVPHDGVFDRSEISHAVNLFDMASKYAEVLDTSEAISLLRGMHASSCTPQFQS